MKILYLQYSNPGAYPAAMRAGRLWRAAGHEVRYLGLDLGGDDKLAVAADLASDCRWVRAGALGPARFAGCAAALILRWKPDWLYVADTMAAMMTLPLRAIYGGGIAYHEHDTPAPATSGRIRRLWQARNAMARRADIVVLPNRDRAAQLVRDAGLRPDRQPVVAWNTPCRDEIGPSRGNVPIGPLRIVYAGSINTQRVPMALIAALAAVPSTELTLIGYETHSSRGHIDALRTAAATQGCADRLIVRDAMPHHDLVAGLGAYDAAFVALPIEATDINHRHMVGASNKSFDALGQGAALIVGPGDDWHAGFVAPGYALSCDPGDNVSIAAAFQQLAEDRAATQAMGERGRQRVASDWAYDVQFAPVRDRMTAGYCG